MLLVYYYCHCKTEAVLIRAKKAHTGKTAAAPLILNLTRRPLYLRERTPRPTGRCVSPKGSPDVLEDRERDSNPGPLY
jgi:hypothetical protein